MILKILDISPGSDVRRAIDAIWDNDVDVVYGRPNLFMVNGELYRDWEEAVGGRVLIPKGHNHDVLYKHVVATVGKEGSEYKTVKVTKL
jgi:hypothetical protein